MSIEKQPFYSQLTLTAKRKTKKLIELKAKKESTGKYDSLLLVLFILAVFHIAFNYENYFMLFPLNMIFKPFIDLSNTAGWSAAANTNMGLLTKAFYYLTFTAAIALGYLLPKIAGSKKKAADSYEALRKDIIKLLDAGFCSCGSSNCICKDTYIDYMDKNEHIDLIF